MGGSLGCGRVPVRVRGVVVDAMTGVPIQGASLLTLFRPEVAANPAELEDRREIAQQYEGLPRADLLRFAWIAGSARTQPDGAFEIIVGIGISGRYGGISGIRWSRERGSAFTVARALLVEREGYETLVHRTQDARWEERAEDGVVGTLEVGTIRLARPPAR